MAFRDIAAERGVLAGILRYGVDAYYDVADILESNSFSLESNQVIYSCLKEIFEDGHTGNIDLALLLSTAKKIGVSEFLSQPTEMKHLNGVMRFPVEMSSIRKLGKIVSKLDLAKKIYDQLELAKQKYLEVKGTESVSQILGHAEESIFEFMSLVNGGEDTPQKIFGNIDEYLNQLCENPTDQVGIPTGFPKYDFAIGGGLRPGTVNVIGARPKTGKTLLAQNMGIHIAKNYNIPVLILDTEMQLEDQIHRGLASETKTHIKDIETGQFGKQDTVKNKVFLKAQKLKNVPIYHIKIAGRAFEEQLSIMRRWIARNVGIGSDGKANDCVIIYDYLKLMNAAEVQNIQEFQALGFMMTGLHNFAVQYKVPILSFIQLNRDGITKESTDAASGSDRIIWLCSNFTIYKKKSDEEIAQDGIENGNRKLVPIVARHGEGLEDKDYINVLMQGQYAHLREGKTAKELEEGVDYTEDERESETEDIPF